MMATLRWVAFILFLICMGVLASIPRGLASMIVAAIAAVAFAAMCFTFGAFSRSRTSPQAKDNRNAH